MSRMSFAALALSPLLAGCLSYGLNQVSAMSSYDLCALQAEQRMNLTSESQRLVQSEIDRRKENCARYAGAIQTQRSEDLYDRTYRTQSP
jgi:hypothetical protein